MHQAVSELGLSLAKTVIKADILNECMTKVGSKHAVNYRTNFGETDKLLEQDTDLADRYLLCICVWAGSTTTCETL